MSQICFVNTYPADARYSYDARIALLRSRKVAQTAEKAKLGGDALVVREFSHEPSFAPKGKCVLQSPSLKPEEPP